MSTHDLLVGFAQILNSGGVGVYDTDRTWTADDTEWAVLVGNKIPQDPPKLIVIGSYVLADDPVLNDSTKGVQIRFRGDEDEKTVLDKEDDVFNLLQGMHDTTVNGVPLVQMGRKSALPLGPDMNNREERSANYAAQIAEPTLYRLD